MSRRRLLLAGATIVALAVLIPIGRFEGAQADDSQLAGIAALRAKAGPLDQASAWRITYYVDCLLFPKNGDPYARELCFDKAGRLIEAIDRHNRNDPEIWSVRYDPAQAGIREDPYKLFLLFKRLGAFRPSLKYPGVLPYESYSNSAPEVSPGDTGPVLVHAK